MIYTHMYRSFPAMLQQHYKHYNNCLNDLCCMDKIKLTATCLSNWWRKVCLLVKIFMVYDTAFMSKEDYVTTSYTWDFIPPITTKEAVERIQMDDTSARKFFDFLTQIDTGLDSKCILRHSFWWPGEFNAGTSVLIW